MLGTIVNCVAIIAGSLVGILFSSKISDEVSDVISSAAGVVTLIIGMQMAFQTVNVIYLALSLIAGGLIGSWWDIDGKILALGHLLEHRFGGGRKNGAAVPGDAGSPARKGTTRFSTRNRCSTASCPSSSGPRWESAPLFRPSRYSCIRVS